LFAVAHEHHGLTLRNFGECVLPFTDTHGILGGIVIVLGIVLLVVAYLLGIPILWTLGIILVVVGVILELLGALDHPFMGRRHYW
jgi:hypothetical protein